MIELPEAFVLADQMTQRLQGRRIRSVLANHSPHRFALYHGEPEGYNDLLSGEFVGVTKSYGGNIETDIGDKALLLHDGANPRFFDHDEKIPENHQLLIEFEDNSSFVVTVQMYGGIFAMPKGEDDNMYHLISKEKPSPLSDNFTLDYFMKLCQYEGFEKHSAKAFLATEQRIPGLGNGVLQDIIWTAGIHPKTKMGNVSPEQLTELYSCIKSLLLKMTVMGGRDTQRDLYGDKGGYVTQLGKNTLHNPCPVCGIAFQKQAYMGGSIYFCTNCQH